MILSKINTILLEGDIMSFVRYEPHIHEDPSFPIIFHLDYIAKNANFLTHWHENIEILFITEGSVSVLCDANRFTAEKGDLVVINSNNIHYIQSLAEYSEYYCLIADKKFCEEFNLYTDDTVFESIIRDNKAGGKFIEIINEYAEKKMHYKSAVKALIIELIVFLYRNHAVSETPIPSNTQCIKTDMIKKSIKYIQDNFTRAISTSDVAKEMKMSESYFCRVFKEITGCTVVFYINFMRCSNAFLLFNTGKYTVGEVAVLCGFGNLSYFSKTYKKHMGCLPSFNKNADEIVWKDGKAIPRIYFTDFS